jgi:hypothetical protein
MCKAIAFMRAHGDVIARYPGDYWCGPRFDRYRSLESSTVQALVDRGLAEYHAWAAYSRGSGLEHFPIGARLTAQSAAYLGEAAAKRPISPE